MNSKFRCKGCKVYYPSEQKIKIISGSFHSFDCATEFATKKAIKDKEKQRDTKHKALKKKVKTNNTKHQHKLTQQVFNKLRKLEELKWFSDKGLEPECISCGKTKMDWCCGHFKTVGAQGGLRYDRVNTYLQCNRYCNMGLSGNIEGNKTTRGFKQGLIERFGNIEGKAIIEYCESNTAINKLSGDRLIEMRKEFNQQIREMENDTSNC